MKDTQILSQQLLTVETKMDMPPIPFLNLLCLEYTRTDPFAPPCLWQDRNH